MELRPELHVEMKRLAFMKTKNPLYAIEGFILSINDSRAPPYEIMEWLSDCFRRWHAEEGELPMDEAMGLNKGPGKDPIFKSAYLEERNDTVFMDMACMIEAGLTVDKAAEVAAYKLETQDWNKTRYKMKSPSWDSLLREFYSWPCRKEMMEFIKGKIGPDYLKNVPADLMPEKMRGRTET